MLITILNLIPKQHLNRHLVNLRTSASTEDIKFTQAPKGVSKLNGIVERYNRTLSELANAFLYHGRVSPILGIRVQTLQLDLQPFDTYRTWDIRPMRSFTI